MLAVGAQHFRLLSALGFRTEAQTNGGACGHPGLDGDGRRNRRNIRLLLSDELGLAVLQTDAMGTFRPPSCAFDPAVKELLGL